MRALAIFGGADAPATTPLTIDGCAVRSAIVRADEPAFDPGDPRFARRVVVRVTAFSCNYRDKGFILEMRKRRGDQFFAVGSEFAGLVVEVGPGVETLAVGDRVIGQNQLTGVGITSDGLREGVPTNSASKEYQVLHETQLIRIPDALGDETAAVFSIGTQTAFSMIRKLDPQPGQNVLVTSATSNTSLSLIAGLRKRGVNLFATTGSAGFDERLAALGVHQLIHVRRDGDSFEENASLASAARDAGGFHHVFDPFFDLHMERSIALLRPFGKYTFCGFYGQNEFARRSAPARPVDSEKLLVDVMVRNISVIGNCLGLREDLEEGIADFVRGDYRCVVDSVYSGLDSDAFLDRTYVDRSRFGKVAFSYLN